MSLNVLTTNPYHIGTILTEKLVELRVSDIQQCSELLQSVPHSHLTLLKMMTLI